jgi:hypothetical protein
MFLFLFFEKTLALGSLPDCVIQAEIPGGPP